METAFAIALTAAVLFFITTILLVMDSRSDSKKISELSENYHKLKSLMDETRIKASADFDALLTYAIKTFYFTGKGLVLPDDKHAQSLIIEVDAISLDDAFRVLRHQKRKYAYNAEVRYYVSASTEELATTPKLLTFKEAK